MLSVRFVPHWEIMLQLKHAYVAIPGGRVEKLDVNEYELVLASKVIA